AGHGGEDLAHFEGLAHPGVDEVLDAGRDAAGDAADEDDVDARTARAQATEGLGRVLAEGREVDEGDVELAADEGEIELRRGADEHGREPVRLERELDEGANRGVVLDDEHARAREARGREALMGVRRGARLDGRPRELEAGARTGADDIEATAMSGRERVRVTETDARTATACGHGTVEEGAHA